MNRIRIFLAFAFILTAPCAFAQKLQVGTNMGDWLCFGTVNAHVDFALSRHWTLGASAKYNPFTFDRDGGSSQMQLKQRSVSVNGRWWPWYVYSGWWLNMKLRVQEYSMGGLISPSTEEGLRYGGGVGAGYSYMITPHLNLDMGLGVWAGAKTYTVFSCPKCGDRLDQGVKAFVMPSDVIISLSYVF